MSLQLKKVAKGGSVLFVGEIVVQFSGFLRNIIIARIIAPDQFGIAAALAMTVAMVEMFSDLGVGRYLTRLAESDEKSWLSTANAISLLRGALGSTVLFFLASPIAASLNMEEHIWSFQLIAILPLVKGFTHNEIWFSQRKLHYNAYVICQAFPQVITLLVSIPLALWLKDFRAMMFILILNSILNVTLSHLVLKQKYLVKIDRVKVKKLLQFGTPLLFDGLLVFLILHGDRLIFARYYGADMLGIYSAAFLLAWTPTAVVGRIAASLGLPYFSGFRDNVTERDKKYSHAVLLSFIPAVCLAALFSVAGSELIQIAFGNKYSTESHFIAWLGFGRALAVLRTIPIVLALAEGHSIVTVLANSVRSLAVVVGLVIAQSVTPTVIMGIAAIGEIGALITSVYLVRRYYLISAMMLFKPTLLTIVVFFCGLLVNKQLTSMGLGEYTILLYGVFSTILVSVVVLISNRVLRRFCFKFISRYLSA